MWGVSKSCFFDLIKSSIFDRFLIDFGPILGPSWEPLGAMLRQNGPPKLSQVCFLGFFTLLETSKFQSFFEVALGPSWSRLGTVLCPFWESFGSQNRCQHRPWRKCEKCIFASTRIKKSMFKRIEKAAKIDVKTTCQACSQEVPKILQQSPKRSQEGPKRLPKRCQIWLQL